MSLLFDRYGNKIQSDFFRATNRRSGEMPRELTNSKPFSIDAVDMDSHLKLIGMSRKLYCNNGSFKSLVEFYATWAIQSSFNPVFLGKDKSYGEECKEWLNNNFLDSVNLTKNNSFRTQLYLDCISTDREGDVFTVLTTDENGMAKLMSYPAFSVHNGPDNDKVSTGQFKGCKINKGIVSDKLGRTIGYRFVSEESFTDIPSAFVLHLYDPIFHDQNRGFPVLTHGLKNFAQIDESLRMEMLNQLISSSISLVETNESGGYEGDQLLGDPDSTSTTTPTVVNDMAGGAIKFFKAGTGSNIQALNVNRPLPSYHEFQDKLLQGIAAGMGVSYSLLFEKDLPSVAMRAALRKSEISLNDRIDLLKGYGKKIITFALSNAIQRGELRASPEFMNWTFTSPSKLSIDIGRDQAAEREAYKLGSINMEDMLSNRGQESNVEEHYNIRAREEAYKKLAAQKASEEFGIEIKPEDLSK